MIILYNTTNMACLQDGQVRQIFNSSTCRKYKVTIPAGWVNSHRDKLGRLSDDWVWGDIYQECPPDMLPEMPYHIKAAFELNPPLPLPVPDQQRADYMGMDGGKSKKRPTRRRRSSKASKARKARKTRTTRRR
jgi:hypothetical protein